MFKESLRTILENVGDFLLTQRAVKGVWEGTQLKTSADITANIMICEQLNTIDPNIPIISEETTSSHATTRPEKYWLIDPIDGTASLSGGFSGFVSQIALMEAKKPIIAAVYAPALNLFYYAEKGFGATLNGEKLILNMQPSRKLLIDNYPTPKGITKQVYEELHCSGYVESGSLGLKICRIADGTADLFVKDVTVKDWDIAPADLILSEAGGSLCQWDGQPFIYRGSYSKVGIIASNSDLLKNEVLNWKKFGSAD